MEVPGSNSNSTPADNKTATLNHIKFLITSVISDFTWTFKNSGDP